MRTTRPFIWIIYTAALVLFPLSCSDDGGPTGPGTVTPPPPVQDVDSIPPAGINTLVCKSPTARSLALQWVAPGDDGWDGSASEFEIRYSLSPISEASWDLASLVPNPPVPSVGKTVQKFRVLGLEPATTYHFAMRSRDDKANVSELSNLSSGVTLQEVEAPSTAMDLTVTETGPGTYVVTWTAPGDDGILGQASGYDLRYSTRVIDESNWATATPVTDLPAPKPAGQLESVLVTVGFPDRNCSFALKVCDEVPNWSTLSSPALALGSQVFLWVYPESVEKGEAITVLFRAPGDGDSVRVEIHELGLGLCGTGDVQLFSGVPEAGTYTLKYDFFDEEKNTYRQPDWYNFSVCISGERKAYSRVQFIE